MVAAGNPERVRIVFWSDQPSGATDGVAPPASWHLETMHRGVWISVKGVKKYPVNPMQTFLDVSFPRIETQCLRAVFNASGSEGHYAAVAVEEWEALTPVAALPSTRGAPPADASACAAP